jgi:hypothetical protein
MRPARRTLRRFPSPASCRRQSAKTMRVLPSCPCTALIESMPRSWNTTEVGHADVHLSATVPSENSTPSATTPVPEMPVSSTSRMSTKGCGNTPLSLTRVRACAVDERAVLHWILLMLVGSILLALARWLF